jgi:hypothetical protein
MAESTQHLQLLQRILDYVWLTFGELYSLSVLHDLPTTVGGEKPPRLGGFCPDVYATDVPVTTTIIGEAKTARDLETEHSRNQLTAFIAHLSSQSSGVLIVAVPWQSTGAAQRMLRQLASKAGECKSTPSIVILSETSEYKVQ